MPDFAARLQASRSGPTVSGRWKQRKPQEATHLPFRAGYNWTRTAKAGLEDTGKTGIFYFMPVGDKLCEIHVKFFIIFRLFVFLLATEEVCSYNGLEIPDEGQEGLVRNNECIP